MHIPLSDGLEAWGLILVLAAIVGFVLWVGYGAARAVRMANGLSPSPVTLPEVVCAWGGALAFLLLALCLVTQIGHWAGSLVAMAFFGGALLGVYLYHRVTGMIE